MKSIKALDRRLLTRTEVAEIFRVAPSTVTRWAEAGKLPSVKTLGGHRRYEAKAVMELAQHQIEEETSMKKVFIDVPAMFGDHHVLEVRRILLALPGVEEANASSCFKSVEVGFDSAKVTADEIRARLDEAGYLEELLVPVETGVAASQGSKQNGKGFFRHTTTYEQTKQMISFAQMVNYSQRPLWPCPGVGVIKRADVEKAAELHKEATHG